jgi:hypothetical protein
LFNKLHYVWSKVQQIWSFQALLQIIVLRPQAARGPSEVAQMRFTISVKVSFENSVADESSFEQRFSRSRDYDADLNFSDIETELSAEIIKELTEDILNRAIANW